MQRPIVRGLSDMVSELAFEGGLSLPPFDRFYVSYVLVAVLLLLPTKAHSGRRCGWKATTTMVGFGFTFCGWAGGASEGADGHEQVRWAPNTVFGLSKRRCCHPSVCLFCLFPN